MSFRLDLLYPARFERAFRAYAETPLIELWRLWMRYADFHYLRRAYPKASDEDISLVATYVRQAHEFHVAGSSTSLLTRPLLIYYSLHNLAKAVLMLKNAGTPPGYHGLAKAVVADGVLESSAEVKGGLFPAISSALGRNLVLGRRWTILELVQNTIELREPLARYYEKTIFYVDVEVDARFGGHLALHLSVPPGKEQDQVGQLAATTDLLNDFEPAVETGRVTLTPRQPLPKDDEFEYHANNLLEKHLQFSVYDTADYLIKVAPDAAALPSAAAYLGYMFILSSLVRYNPRQLELFLGLKETSHEWFIEELCAKAERVGPNLLLNALHEYPVKIGT